MRDTTTPLRSGPSEGPRNPWPVKRIAIGLSVFIAGAAAVAVAIKHRKLDFLKGRVKAYEIYSLKAQFQDYEMGRITQIQLVGGGKKIIAPPLPNQLPDSITLVGDDSLAKLLPQEIKPPLLKGPTRSVEEVVRLVQDQAKTAKPSAQLYFVKGTNGEEVRMGVAVCPKPVTLVLPPAPNDPQRRVCFDIEGVILIFDREKHPLVPFLERAIEGISVPHFGRQMTWVMPGLLDEIGEGKLKFKLGEVISSAAPLAKAQAETLPINPSIYYPLKELEVAIPKELPKAPSVLVVSSSSSLNVQRKISADFEIKSLPLDLRKAFPSVEEILRSVQEQLKKGEVSGQIYTLKNVSGGQTRFGIIVSPKPARLIVSNNRFEGTFVHGVQIVIDPCHPFPTPLMEILWKMGQHYSGSVGQIVYPPNALDQLKGMVVVPSGP